MTNFLAAGLSVFVRDICIWLDSENERESKVGKCSFKNNVSLLCGHVLVNGVSVVKDRNALRRTEEAFFVRSD